MEEWNTIVNLKQAIIELGRREEQDRQKFDEEQKKVKFSSQEQAIIVSELITKAEVPGMWEYDIKKLVDSSYRYVGIKLSFGNYLNIKNMKHNLRTNVDLKYLAKKDWVWVSSLLAIHHLKQTTGESDLKTLITMASKDRDKNSKYNWNKHDSKKLDLGMSFLSEIEIEKQEPKKRVKGKKAIASTVTALKEAREEKVKVTVNEQDLDIIDTKNLHELDVSFSVCERRHWKTNYNKTTHIKQNTSLKLTEFTKEPTQELKQKMTKMLKGTKNLAKRKEKAKETIIEKDQRNPMKKKLSEAEEVKKLELKRLKLRDPALWKKCQFCEYFAEVNSVILNGHENDHHKGYHLEHLKKGGKLEHFYPVIKILHK